MNNRNYGIDILRSVSMLMIVMLHILGVGGILAGTAPGSGSYNSAWVLESLCMCAVNCFGLVSGYVVSTGRYRGGRLFSLWLRVVAEGLLVTALFAFFGTAPVEKSSWISSLLPVTKNVYWYFTAYFALFFFIPYINKMIASLSKVAFRSLATGIVMVFCFAGNTFGTDIFFVHGGYSFLWLLCLYILGAYMRTIPINQKIHWAWFAAAFVAFSVLAFIGKTILEKESLLNYNSPFILFSAAALLLLFRRIKVKGKFKIRTIGMLTRTSFGVYIIHTNPLVWNRILAGSFAGLAQLPIPLMIGSVILAAAVIYALGTVLDWCVEKFFKLIRVDALERAFEKLLRRLIYLGKNTKRVGNKV